MNGFDKIRDWLFKIRFTRVILIGFSACLLVAICVKPLGEAGFIAELPLLVVWLITCALVVAHGHRAFAQSGNALIQFGGPVAVGVLYASFTISAGVAAGFWLATNISPAAFR